MESALIFGLTPNRMLKKTNIGPHRDDLAISLDTGCGQHLARKIASQGQARSLALALKMAAVEYVAECSSFPPLLLLDDVESELDEDRKQSLYDLISRLKSQVIITATEPSESVQKALSEVEILEISRGMIQRHQQTPKESPKSVVNL